MFRGARTGGKVHGQADDDVKDAILEEGPLSSKQKEPRKSLFLGPGYPHDHDDVKDSILEEGPVSRKQKEPRNKEPTGMQCVLEAMYFTLLPHYIICHLSIWGLRISEYCKVWESSLRLGSGQSALRSLLPFAEVTAATLLLLVKVLPSTRTNKTKRKSKASKESTIQK
jgi:hypothetical protein